LTSDRFSILGSKSASVSVEFPGSIEPVKCLLIESGGFHDFVEEHDWHDVDVEIALPGRDRTYLLTQLGVDKSCSIPQSFPVIEEGDGVEEAEIEADHETGYPSEEGGVPKSKSA
jgi:hypothetical protein